MTCDCAPSWGLTTSPPASASPSLPPWSYPSLPPTVQHAGLSDMAEHQRADNATAGLARTLTIPAATVPAGCPDPPGSASRPRPTTRPASSPPGWPTVRIRSWRCPKPPALPD